MFTAKAGDDSAHSEYQQYVHSYVNSSKSNWTSVDKPMFPVHFNDTEIAIGSTWSIVEPLVANHSYHVYCYGKWVNNGSAPKTDYDIYVFNPQGVQESEHTEAAGLPEHLGTRVNDTFFVPSVSGDYTFVIANDARQSNGTEQATFMAIENIESDKWYTRSIEGKSLDNLGVFNTTWAYEFVTDKPQIEVYAKVPDTLDMYEARLYIMSDPQSLAINGAPLPWEPGLYGNLTGDVGGYSLDSDNYRGAAYASCEYKGQDMLLKYSSAATGKTLYHLVLIGEAGAGNIDFLVKTRFGDASLAPANILGRIYPWNETTVAYVSNATDLDGAVMDYSTNHWNSTQSTEMKIENQTCSAVIPRQKAGTFVEYKVRANDTLMNALQAEGNFTVKQLAMLNITAVREKVRMGDNITVNGVLTGQNGSVPVTVQFMNSNETDIVESLTSKDGTFTVNFRANSTGVWAVQATFAGSYAVYPCESTMLTAKVEEQPFYVKNGALIGGGFFGLIIVSGAVFYIRKRRQ
jgi:LysM repeat protein